MRDECLHDGQKPSETGLPLKWRFGADFCSATEPKRVFTAFTLKAQDYRQVFSALPFGNVLRMCSRRCLRNPI